MQGFDATYVQEYAKAVQEYAEVMQDYADGVQEYDAQGINLAVFLLHLCMFSPRWLQMPAHGGAFLEHLAACLDYSESKTKVKSNL